MANPIIAEQFESLEQQHEADQLGLWTFLATEVLFFGGLFMAYIVYRTTYPREFSQAAQHANLVLGTINTAVLLSSSLCMAMAVNAAQAGSRRLTQVLLLATACLGLAFLGIKGAEYYEHYLHHLVPGPHFSGELARGGQLYFWLYFTMTGLHGIHVLIGLLVISVMWLLVWKAEDVFQRHIHLEMAGLYWHFVDIVWVFLYPMFYLIPHGH